MNNQIKIKCTSGMALPLSEISLFPSKLKKHSILEIERIVDSIEKDGFLFPLAIGKVNGKNYVINGEATFKALQELNNRNFEIPEIPIYYVKCTEDTIRKMILIGTSINHIVTKSSLEEFVKDSDYEELIKDLAFNEGSLINFWTECDLEKTFSKFMVTKPKNVATVEDYEKLVMGGKI